MDAAVDATLNGANAPITIVLADDHKILRQSLKALLEREHDLKVIGKAGDGLSAIEVVERLRPDVLVLDVMLPRLNGLEVLRHVKRLVDETRIVMLSMFADEVYVSEAMGSGASAYVLKCEAFEDLARAIRSAVVGGRYLSEPLAQLTQASENGGRTVPEDRYKRLTAREKQVLHLSAEGFTASEIAERLGIRTRTAEKHRSNLRKKLGLKTLGQLIAFALRRGLIVSGV